ncbi:MAG: Xaa-Pro peptidase family protein [Syntrophomonadaceae bacterium]|nr:Xaa-Pro peptidase family protein [Syntrophomonadaceae bacterium]
MQIEPNRLQRIQKLRLLMQQNEVDAFIVVKAENIYYLSGFTSGEDALLLITGTDKFILTDARYSEQLKQEAPDWNLLQGKPGSLDELKEVTLDCQRIGIEDSIVYRQFCELHKQLPNKMTALSGLVEELRIIKDETELDLMRKCASISDIVFSRLLDFIKPGITEIEVANFIANALREGGCQKEAFDTIAVSAENAALPHGKPGKRLLTEGDMLTLDFGGIYAGYCADMTRTVVIESASQRLHSLYEQVFSAQMAGVAAVKPGITAAQVDKIVRDCLAVAGLDKYFVHGTGHGLGLEVHEKPTVSPRGTGYLEENMVITIEPGIYIPGWGGIRIEDSVIVKSGGCEIITCSDKNLILI